MPNFEKMIQENAKTELEDNNLRPIESVQDEVDDNYSSYSNTRKPIMSYKEFIKNQEQFAQVSEQMVEAISKMDKVENIKQDIQLIETQITTYKQLLSDLQSNTNRIVATTQSKLSDQQQISTYKEEIKKYLADIKETHKEALGEAYKMRKDTRKLQEEINGVPTVGEDGLENYENGLKQVLNTSFNTLEARAKELSSNVDDVIVSSKNDFQVFLEESKSTNEQLEKEIRAILKESSTAGLSGAFEKRRQTEEGNLKKNYRGFFGALLVLFIASFCYVLSALNALKAGLSFDFRLVLFLIPISIPVIWVAIHYNKKINLTQKLIEEYAHKEAVAKTIGGLAEHIKIIENKDVSEALYQELILLIINSSSNNPAQYVKSHNSSDHPLTEALSSLKVLNKMMNKNPALGNLISSSMPSKVKDIEKKKIEE